MESERVHRGVSKIQAIWKGYKLRKSLLETRKEYEEIFNEIQRNFNDGIGIEWPRVRLCMPVFTRISEKQLSSSDVKVTTENVEISTGNVIDDDAPAVSESDGIRTEYDNQRVANNNSKNSTTNNENNPIASDDNCSRTSRSGSIRATKDDNVDLIKDNGNVRIASENASDRSRSNSLQTDKSQIAERDSDGSSPPLSLTFNDSDERTKTVNSHPNVSSPQRHQENKRNAKIRGDEITQNNSNTGDFLELNSNAATGCSRQQHDTTPLRTNETSTSTPRAGEFDDDLHEDVTDIGCRRSVDSFDFVETRSEISVIENGKNSAGNSAHNILTDSWITNKSFCYVDTRASVDNKSESELLKMKEDLSLELLWIGQAITSRKVYLRMKHGT